MMMNTVFLRLLPLLFHLQLQLLVSYPWSAVGSQVRCIETERQALLHLKAGFVDDFSFLSSWGNEHENRDCCQWERVRCSNRTGHVHMLHLQGEEYSELYRYDYEAFDYYDDARPHLRGKISTSLMQLQHLRYLNLSLNDFEYSHIPEFFGSLHNLRYLDVSDSSFAGKIPAQLGSLSNLQHLDLSVNSLEGAIPSQLGNLSQLQYLDVRDNNLIGAVPYQLKSLSSLQKLYLGYNDALKIHNENFADTQWLSNLTSLAILDFSKVLNLNHSHSWLQTINKLPNFRELYLVGCDLPDDDLLFQDPSKFNFSSSLTVLDLSELPNLNHSHYFLQMIGKLQNLRELFLVDSQLSDNDHLFLDPFKLNFSSSLTTLHLSSNDFSTKFLRSLRNICTLSTLILTDVNLSEDFSAILQSLSGCASHTLRELNLGSNQITGWLPDLSKFSSLEILDVYSNFVEGFIPESFAKICSLHSLTLSRNSLSSELPEIIQNLFGCRSTLQLLYLDENQITGVLPDLSRFQSLKSLYLSRNQLNGISEAVGLPSTLEILDVSSNFLQDGIPKSFGKICSLHALKLSNSSLSNELPMIIHNLFGCRSTLQVLNLDKNQITGVLPDLSKFPSLKSLCLNGNKLIGTAKGVRLPSKLENLGVSSNSLEDGILESFGKICSLRSLDLSNNSLSNELPVIIHNLFRCARSLHYLNLSRNQINGTIPDLSKFSSLENLYLSGNHLNGEIPKHIRLPSRLVWLDLASNSNLTGVFTESYFANISMLDGLDLSFTSLSLTFSPNWVPPFQLSYIYLQSCIELGPKFPKWLQSLKTLSILDISDSRISDIVPEWFWSLSSKLEFLNISYNNLTGTIPNFSIRHSSYAQIILASNQFEGSIPQFLGSAGYLDLSKNKFSSCSMFLCANSSSEIMAILDLSNNQLFGLLPDCWNNFKSLTYLDMSNNKLFGKVPSSMGSLVELKVLVLRNNKFHGALPLSLKNCTNLVMLDVGENRFSGQIPYFIGNEFKQLMMLSLRFNHFSGSIPLELCHLTSLQFLDLSFNNLSGEVLKCLKNLTAMSQKEKYLHTVNYCLINNTDGTPFYGSFFDLNVFLMWKGVEQKFKNNAFLLKSIDLSSNQLIGEIPADIINLVELVSLNLSRNNLRGVVPSEIGRLKSLEFLDLSRNHFYGEIPSSLAWIDRLTMLDLSHNQLSGKIPISTQLQSFDASSYEENLALCGKPLKNNCPEEEAIQKPPKVEENEHSIFSQRFYISMALGFIVGFWGIFGSILVLRPWRHAYFRLLNNLTDAIYVMVAIMAAKSHNWLND